MAQFLASTSIPGPGCHIIAVWWKGQPGLELLAGVELNFKVIVDNHPACGNTHNPTQQ
jgi:hypothetical protein